MKLTDDKLCEVFLDSRTSPDSGIPGRALAEVVVIGKPNPSQEPSLRIHQKMAPHHHQESARIYRLPTGCTVLYWAITVNMRLLFP